MIKKRKIKETYDVKTTQIIKLTNVDVPIEIILRIFKFLEKNIYFLNSVGLVNSKFRMFSLMSWRVLNLDYENIKKIPILVINFVKIVVLCCDELFKHENYTFLQKNFHNVKTLVLKGLFPFFLDSLEKSGIIIRKCKILEVGFEELDGVVVPSKIEKVNDFVEFKVPNSFPDLHTLCFNDTEKPLETKIMTKIECIRIFSEEKVFGGEVYEIPLYFQNLKLTHIFFEVTLSLQSWEVLSKISSLEVLSLFITKKEEFEMLSKHVYHKLSNITFLILRLWGIDSPKDPNKSYFEDLSKLDKLEQLRIKQIVYAIRDDKKINNMDVVDVNFKCLLNFNKMGESLKIITELKNFSEFELLVELYNTGWVLNEMKDGIQKIEDFKEKLDNIFSEDKYKIDNLTIGITVYPKLKYENVLLDDESDDE